MYTQVWMKFIPVIRIMLKRAVTAPQVLKLNRSDFDKAGGGKKVGYKFLIEFKNGKVQNRFTSAIAKDLVTALQQDEAAMAILAGRDFVVEMNPKCEMGIKYTTPPLEVEEDGAEVTEDVTDSVED